MQPRVRKRLKRRSVARSESAAANTDGPTLSGHEAAGLMGLPLYLSVLTRAPRSTAQQDGVAVKKALVVGHVPCSATVCRGCRSIDGRPSARSRCRYRVPSVSCRVSCRERSPRHAIYSRRRMFSSVRAASRMAGLWAAESSSVRAPTHDAGKSALSSSTSSWRCTRLWPTHWASIDCGIDSPASRRCLPDGRAVDCPDTWPAASARASQRSGCPCR